MVDELIVYRNLINGGILITTFPTHNYAELNTIAED